MLVQSRGSLRPRTKLAAYLLSNLASCPDSVLGAEVIIDGSNYRIVGYRYVEYTGEVIANMRRLSDWRLIHRSLHLL